MDWILVAVAAYFLNAVTPLIDKFLLGDHIPNPTVYAFYVGLLSIVAVIMAPFGLIWPGTAQFLFSLVSGALFLFGLYVFFIALKRQEASRVVPVVGAFVPLVVSVLAYLWLGDRLDRYEMIAFVLLVSGGVLMSVERETRRLSPRGVLVPLAAAFLMGASYVLLKGLFGYQPFISSFVWTRVGTFLAALSLLIPSVSRRAIIHSTKALRVKTTGLFIFNKALGGVTYLLLNFAFFLGSVTLVNAMQGVQYLFLFLFTVILSRFFPKVLKEELTTSVVVQKLAAILIITAGLGVLSYH